MTHQQTSALPQGPNQNIQGRNQIVPPSKVTEVYTFVTDKDISQAERYLAKRKFILSILGDDVPAPSNQQSDLGSSAAIPTPPPGTKDYFLRVRELRVETMINNATPLTAIGSLARQNVVLGIEKDILKLELRKLTNDMEVAVVIRQQLEAAQANAKVRESKALNRICDLKKELEKQQDASAELLSAKRELQTCQERYSELEYSVNRLAQGLRRLFVSQIEAYHTLKEKYRKNLSRVQTLTATVEKYRHAAAESLDIRCLVDLGPTLDIDLSTDSGRLEVEKLVQAQVTEILHQRIKVALLNEDIKTLQSICRVSLSMKGYLTSGLMHENEGFEKDLATVERLEAEDKTLQREEGSRGTVAQIERTVEIGEPVSIMNNQPSQQPTTLDQKLGKVPATKSIRPAPTSEKHPRVNILEAKPYAKPQETMFIQSSATSTTSTVSEATDSPTSPRAGTQLDKGVAKSRTASTNQKPMHSRKPGEEPSLLAVLTVSVGIAGLLYRFFG